MGASSSKEAPAVDRERLMAVSETEHRRAVVEHQFRKQAAQTLIDDMTIDEVIDYLEVHVESGTAGVPAVARVKLEVERIRKLCSQLAKSVEIGHKRAEKDELLSKAVGLLALRVSHSGGTPAECMFLERADVKEVRR